MFAWIAQNAATIISAAAVLILVGIAVFALIKQKKSKKGGCTGNCASCGSCCPYCKDKQS
ncbi:MAG: FeoB-associated Cys-rich membrane protein [Clostridia bacterium]|nr:FeoB-associated Cys-rich membrane protein [Clostridia bacterium]